MYKTKAKSKIKNKLWKIFTKEMVHKRMVQKLLSVGVSVSLMMAMVPQTAWGAEPDKFVASAKANHWGRSDLRSYLNGVAKSSETLPLDTTTHARQISGYYESQFTDAEFGLVKPFTYSTNVLDSSSNATATYDTTDRFWLPSANYNKDQILSWGREDISSASQYTATTAQDLARVIPISYWNYGTATYSWLRSPYCDGSSGALRAHRGILVDSSDVSTMTPSQALLNLICHL